MKEEKQGEAVLTLQDVCTGYGRHMVTRNVTASLRRGQLVCLIGRNGCGKSTLLRTLAGFQKALSGQITWFGRPVDSYTDAERAKMVGIVLTERCPSDRLTVAETVRMGRLPYAGFWGRVDAEGEKIVQRALDDVGIRHLVQRRIGTLSDGERQKTMIAKTLAQQTPVVFLDEPTAFLDFPSKIETLRLLKRLAHEQEKAVFLSIHDLDLALQLADELWVMGPDGCIETGMPRALVGGRALNRLLENSGATFDSDTLRFTLNGL